MSTEPEIDIEPALKLVGVQKLPIGIPGFDHITEGGLPKGRCTLVAGTAGSCKTIIAIQFLYAGITQYDESGVFVTFEEHPTKVKENVVSFGWDIHQQEDDGKFAFVDMSPVAGRHLAQSGEFDFSPLLARIEHAVKSVNARRVSIDSINVLFQQFDNSSIVRREMLRLVRKLEELNVTAILTGERSDEFGEICMFSVEEFVSDNVIVLRNILEDERRRRTIEVLKYRGASHYKGEVPFTTSNEGVEILPLSQIQLTQESTVDRTSTGVPDLDVMTDGGFFSDSVILVSGATGTGKTLMSSTFIHEAANNHEKTLYFAFEESRAQLLRNASGWNKDFSELEEKGLVKIVACYPESLGLEDHLLKIKKEIESFKPTRAVVDSLSAMERVASIRSFREFIIGLTAHLKEKRCTTLLTATTSSLLGGSSVTESNISTITDTIILLRYAEVMGEMRRGITVLKMRGSQHDKGIREFNIDGNGMHIGKQFSNIGGILSGQSMQLNSSETERFGGMFDSRLGE